MAFVGYAVDAFISVILGRLQYPSPLVHDLNIRKTVITVTY